MANNEIGALLVNLGLNTARLKGDTDRAVKNFKQTERKMSNSLNGIRRAAASLGLGLSAVGFVSFVNRAIKTADEIGKLSTRLGASTEALSEYRHVAELSGVTFQTLSMGWQRMTRRVAEAARGTGEAKDALIELNLSATDLNNLRPEQQFEVLTDALMRTTNQADRVRLSMKLFDSEGVSLLQTMTEGSAGLREMRQEARDLGISLSKDATDSAAEARDAVQRLKASADALGLTLAKALGPGLADVANWLRDEIPKAVNTANAAIESMGKQIHSIWETFFEDDQVSLPLKEAIGQLKLLETQLQGAAAGSGNAIIIQRQIEEQKEVVAALQRTNAELDKYKLKWRQAYGVVEGEGTKAFKSSAEEIPPVVGGADGPSKGDAAAAKAAETLRLQMQGRLETIETELMTEEERLFESMANRQFIVEEAFESELISQDKRNMLLAQLQADHEKKLTDLKVKGVTERNRYTAILEAKGIKDSLRGLQELTSGVTAENKTLFKVNKYAAIAEATMNTYAAANKAMAQGGLFGYAKAAAIVAAGLANVAKIEATEFGGGSGSGGGMTGGGAIAGGPDSFANDIPPDDTVNDTRGSQITINIEGNVYSNDDFREALVEALQQAQSNDEIRVISAN